MTIEEAQLLKINDIIQFKYIPSYNVDKKTGKITQIINHHINKKFIYFIIEDQNKNGHIYAVPYKWVIEKVINNPIIVLPKLTRFDLLIIED